MEKMVLVFGALNALGLAMVIFFDKKNNRPIASFKMYMVAYIAATTLDVLVTLYIL